MASPVCLFCKAPVELKPQSPTVMRFHCPRCGDYMPDNVVQSALEQATLPNLGAVGGWIRNQNTRGVTPQISGDDLSFLRSLQKPSLNARIERYLLDAATQVQSLNATFHPETPALAATASCDDIAELSVIRTYLAEEGLLKMTNDGLFRLTPKGHIEADALRARRAASTQAFVAMWFDPSLDAAYDQGIKVGVEQAGYSPMIIRSKEHANKIDDEIIAEIRRSAFVVADFTGQRGGVYFEAGFAMGLGLRVIWTCREDEVNKLHFDIRQYNCLLWTDLPTLARSLQLRIEAVLGRGPIGI